MKEVNYKEPNVLLSISQLLAFIASYLIIYFVLGIIFISIANFISGISFLQVFLYAFPVHETIAYTMLPAFSAFFIYAANDFVYKKYYFNLISTALFFMFLSWLMVDHIISTATKYGIISWDFVNWLWSDAIMVIAIFVLFFKRTKFGEEKEKNYGNS